VVIPTIGLLEVDATARKISPLSQHARTNATSLRQNLVTGVTSV
jgi:hypothetical protein